MKTIYYKNFDGKWVKSDAKATKANLEWVRKNLALNGQCGIFTGNGDNLVEPLLKNHLGEYNYHFNWIGGGFNDVWARDMKHFKEVVEKRFPDSHRMVNYSTVKPATKSYADEMDKMGWMMTC
jgi:hypothetical protein